jgi:1,2-phenylacetyl-CoA epoxidase catalytic subunit
VDARRLAYPTEPHARLLLGAAWRQRALGHAMGRALRRVPGGPVAWAVVERLRHALLASDAFLEACSAHGLADAETLVQGRVEQEPLPYVSSLAEAAVADVLYARAADLALEGLAASADAAVAGAARAAGPPPAAFGPGVLAELGAHEPNRACLQILVDRWSAVSVQVLGRPGAPGDDSLLRSGIKRASSADGARRWLRETAVLLEPLGLAIADAQRLGVELP